MHIIRCPVFESVFFIDFFILIIFFIFIFIFFFFPCLWFTVIEKELHCV